MNNEKVLEDIVEKTFEKEFEKFSEGEKRDYKQLAYEILYYTHPEEKKYKKSITNWFCS